eukprot:2836572-Amphidinium_carterae.1
MDLGQAGGSAPSSSSQGDRKPDGEWKEQRRRKPVTKEGPKREVELCPSAWIHQVCKYDTCKVGTDMICLVDTEADLRTLFNRVANSAHT